MSRIPQILQRISDLVLDIPVTESIIRMEDERITGKVERRGEDRRKYNAAVRMEAERRIAERRKAGW